jgi:hypothetical protein
MSVSQELPVIPETQALVPTSPIELMGEAIRQGISAEQLQILQEMHFRQLAWQAELDFNEALNRVQTKIPLVVPDLTNPQTNSKYASFARLDKVVRPIYTAEGFSLSFNTADCPKADHVRIVAYLSRGKHTRTYQLDMPIVTTGIKGQVNMTLTHASASANSYGKRYLECDIFNIPVGEDNDGNLTNGELSKLIDEIVACKTNGDLDAVFQKHYQAAKGNQKLQGILIEAKDRRRKEINQQVRQGTASPSWSEMGK